MARLTSGPLIALRGNEAEEGNKAFQIALAEDKTKMAKLVAKISSLERKVK